MWLQTYEKKLVNMNNVSVVDITPSPLNDKTFRVVSRFGKTDEIKISQPVRRDFGVNREVMS